MTDAPEREYFTDAGFVGRSVRAQFRLVLLTPRRLLPLVLFVVIALFGMWFSPKNGPVLLLLPTCYLALLALTLVPAYFAALRSLAKVNPVGTRYSATLRKDSIAFSTTATTAEVPYSSYRSARRIGEFVVLHFAAVSTRTVLPAQLFPNGDFDHLLAAIAGARRTLPAPAASADLHIPITRTYVTNAGYTQRLTRMLVLWAATRGSLAGLLGVFLGAGVLLLVVSAIGAIMIVSENSTDLSSLVAPLVLVALLFAFAVVLVVLRYVVQSRQIRRSIRVGSVYGIGFGETALAVRMPLNAAELSYASYRRVSVRGDFVVMSGRRGYGPVILPIQLFSPDELQRLIAQVETVSSR